MIESSLLFVSSIFNQPVVDACGNITNNQPICTSVVDGTSIVAGDATIMSYCHFCGAGALVFFIQGFNVVLCTSSYSSENIYIVEYVGATFGGIWDEDDRRDVNNWLE